MDLTNLDQLKSLLSRFHIRPKDFLGQNFLIDQKVLELILETAELKKTDWVLEVGPGAGTLTRELASQSRGVVAVEKDKHYVKLLKFILKDFANIEIIYNDILKIDIPKLFQDQMVKFKVVANIPYYLTGRLLQILLTLKNKPELIVLLLQKEVAERIMAKPGEMSLLALSVQFFGQPKLVREVYKKSFFPQPEVDSAILKINVFSKPKLEVSEKQFFRLVKISFSSRRKTLLNNLCAGFRLEKKTMQKVLEQAKLNLNVRAQELSLEEWQQVYNQLNKKTT
jgi:16S rRNA (adenine1518-N6/adenine1519-N6)-dimethyltransferase